MPDSLLGPVAFDDNGDLRNQIISVFQISKDTVASRSTARPTSTNTSASRPPHEGGRHEGGRSDADMTTADLLLQQGINGLSLGAMYALLALGFTLVYGILELINFSHFNVFMVGSFIALWTLQQFGLSGQETVLVGLPLVGRAAGGLRGDHAGDRRARGGIERFLLRPLREVQGPAAMITTIGVSIILFNIVLLTVGRGFEEFSRSAAAGAFAIGGAVLRLREVLIWIVATLLMLALTLFVQRSKLGKAMRATAQDPDAARMMGVEVDRVIMTAFFLGSALAGASGLIFGLYYNFTSYMIGFNAGLRGFTAAVLGGIGNVPGAMLGGVIIGLVEAIGGQLIGAAWADVVIFAILVLVLVFRPAGPARARWRRTGRDGARMNRLRRRFDMIPQHRRRRLGLLALGVFILGVSAAARQRRRHRQHGQCGRLCDAGARPQHRGRLRRPARPRLCGVLRHRRVFLRRVLQLPDACRLGATAGRRSQHSGWWRRSARAARRWCISPCRSGSPCRWRRWWPPGSACCSARRRCGCAATTWPSSRSASARSCRSWRATPTASPTARPG